MKPITLYDGPLVAQLVLKHPETGEVLFEAEERRLEPSDTYSWQYPQDGITGSVS